jgi:ABC-2 type transport system ATP-binding protein
MGEAIIEVRNLSKKFGSFTAVDNISFEVYKGEIFGFLGANGPETTAMKMLIGISTPTSGEAVAGYNVKSATEMVKKSIGYEPKFSMYDDLTKENITFLEFIGAELK